MIKQELEITSHQWKKIFPNHKKINFKKIFVIFHSDKINSFINSKKKFVYFCRKGTKFNGHQFAKTILDSQNFIVADKKELTSCFSENKLPAHYSNFIFFTKDIEKKLNKTLEIAFHLKNKDFKFIAITGTNGKTSTVQITSQLLNHLTKQKILNLGTLGACIGHKKLPISHVTMPDFPSLCETLNLYKNNYKSKYVIMEATSHGLKENRFGNFKVHYAGFTNLTQDHLDYHKTMDDYKKSKLLLFKKYMFKNSSVVIERESNGNENFWKTCVNNSNIKNLIALLNIENLNNFDTFLSDCKLNKKIDYLFLKNSQHTIRGSQGKLIFYKKNVLKFKKSDLEKISTLKNKINDFISYGFHKNNRELPLNENTILIHFLKKYFKKSEYKIDFPLLGKFQCENILIAIGYCIQLKFSLRDIIFYLKKLKPIDGRLEIAYKNPLVLVDYAHTPDALEKSLKTCRELLPENGRLTVVFGCGGNRDELKRPLMGKTSSELADILYITSDNPRRENPNKIIQDILKGIPILKEKIIHIEPNRETSIKIALKNSLQTDIILIAGKGHENYQEINNLKIPYNDIEVVKNYFKENH